MTLLVIGGAGYIGSSFVDYIFNSSKHKVIVLDDLSTGFKIAVHKKAKFIEGSILDKDCLDKIFKKYQIDAVFHFAAKLIVPESVSEPAKYWLNNVGGVATLLESMKDYNVNKIIFSSTAAVYGFATKTPIDENCPTNPCNPYGSSKLACEKLIQEAKLAYGINYCILRYFNVAGASDNNQYGLRKKEPTLLIPAMNRSLIEKFTMNVFGNDYPNTHDHTCVRDYIHISDLCTAHLQGLDWMIKNNESNIFNLGSSVGFSVLDVLNTANKVLDTTVSYNFAPRRPGDPEILITNNTKAAKILNWKPTKKLEEMIVSDYTFRKKLYN